MQWGAAQTARALHSSLSSDDMTTSPGSRPIAWCRSALDGAGRESGHRGAQTRRFLARNDEGSTTMAETKRMTADEVVSYLLEEEGLDFLRESLTWVVQQLMEAEVSELVGATRGERAPKERLTHRNGYRARTWATRAGELELAIPKIRRGSYFPSFLEPRRSEEHTS